MLHSTVCLFLAAVILVVSRGDVESRNWFGSLFTGSLFTCTKEGKLIIIDKIFFRKRDK